MLSNNNGGASKDHHSRDGGRDGGVGHSNYREQGNYHHQQQDQHERERAGDPNQNADNPKPPASSRKHRSSHDEVVADQPPMMAQGVGSTSTELGESYGRSREVGKRKRRSWGPPMGDITCAPRPLPGQCQSRDDYSVSGEETIKSRVLPMKRPDKGGNIAARRLRLLVNHFLVSFNPKSRIKHYNVKIKQEASSRSQSVVKSVSKTDLRLIREKLFMNDPARFPLHLTAYDGENNIFSAVTLPTGHFTVELSGEKHENSRSYIFTIEFVNELKLSKLSDYLDRKVMNIPRDILQGMDLVMKENPSRAMISVGGSWYSKYFSRKDDLLGGAAALRGFRQSLKPTSQGLALCLDSSVVAFYKRMPIIDFLKEHVRGFQRVDDLRRLRSKVTEALKGLKVTVTHRRTRQNYIIAGLTEKNARDLSFVLEDPKGKKPQTKVELISYFRETYDKEIVYKDVPCLDLGTNKRPNYVPVEFCILANGNRYPNARLGNRFLSQVPPRERKNTICKMVQADDGPCGGLVAQKFGYLVEKSMTAVTGRVIRPPNLKLGNMNTTSVDKDRCHWSLVGKTVVKGKSIEQWALIDFRTNDGSNELDHRFFVKNLMRRCQNLGVYMEEPLVLHSADMSDLSDVKRLHSILERVIDRASRRSKDKLQIIVCVMAEKDPGYKNLKWVSEIEIGILTQCCLSTHANKGHDSYLANLVLKINAKLGGSNFELMERLPHFEVEDHVMFIGADVNHPSSSLKSTSPSIAAVVATVNWPFLNRYAARVSPQGYRKEKIMNFGSMCLDLINTYAQINSIRPKKIVVFRDGVSEGEFDMVLNEELVDLKRKVYEESYQPTVTYVVAQKRHQTRLFVKNEADGVGPHWNVPPGTVVDTAVVHPFEFDFYLCSHYGVTGTSKPVHYFVLWDEHNFTSDELQKLIFDLCFTFARGTKPISLVPPVYYADLVAYRGRMFQEVVMKLHSRPSTSSSSSSSRRSSSTSSFNASFDKKFYKLHPELQDFMFFV